jgi:minor curlin subunit
MHTKLMAILAALVPFLAAASAASAQQQDSVTQSTADVDQIPGNISIIRQNGNTNTATIEQQAILGASYANAASIQQNGAGSIASITQKSGSQLAAGIAQFGNNETATITQQGGTNLGVQINQYSNGASVGVTQFGGTGTPNGPPISIKQF